MSSSTKAIQPGTTELAVILAAGEGSRLSLHRRGIPKPTLRLLGLALEEPQRAALRQSELGVTVHIRRTHRRMCTVSADSNADAA